LQQIERFEPLQPERHSSSRVAAWQKQRPRRIHSEPRAEQRGRADFFHHQLLRFGPGETEQRLHRSGHPQIGESEHYAIIGRLHLQIGVVDRFAHALGECHPPRSVDPAAERGVDHDPHSPGLVPELLDDNVPVVRYDPRCCSL
jgi:hypothetical protein